MGALKVFVRLMVVCENSHFSQILHFLGGLSLHLNHLVA